MPAARGVSEPPPKKYRYRNWQKMRIIRGASFGDYKPRRLTATYRF